jgi:hypothetical protein
MQQQVAAWLLSTPSADYLRRVLAVVPLLDDPTVARVLVGIKAATTAA